MPTANKSYLAKPHEVERRWYIVDATDQVLGRLAVRIATVLMGKHKPTYTPHVDTGDYVVVQNVGKVKLTGWRKPDEIVYQRYSGYPGGLKETSARTMLERHPERVLREAVRRMLPKNPLARQMLLKLKLYEGEEHPHQAQAPDPLPTIGKRR
jgi:large subunit ribosomal protein L13